MTRPAAEAAARSAGSDAANAPIDLAIKEAELADSPPPPPARYERTPVRERLSTVAALSIGGILGAELRFALGRALTPHWHGAIPWTTLLINVSGSFVLGLYLTTVTERFAGRTTTRLFFATGLLGSYTTFSTFSYEGVRLIQHGAYGSAIAYLAITLVGGLLAVGLGHSVANAL